VFIQEQVQSRGYVPFPAAAREIVGASHPVKGPSVYWNYERHGNFVVLSRDALRSDDYVDVGRYKIYDVTGEDDGGRIRVPGPLDDVIQSNFFEGARVIYLAHREMTGADNPTLYLLTNRQFATLLPEQMQPDATDDEGLRDALIDLPEFLPGP